MKNRPVLLRKKGKDLPGANVSKAPGIIFKTLEELAPELVENHKLVFRIKWFVFQRSAGLRLPENFHHNLKRELRKAIHPERQKDLDSIFLILEGMQSIAKNYQLHSEAELDSWMEDQKREFGNWLFGGSREKDRHETPCSPGRAR